MFEDGGTKSSDLYITKHHFTVYRFLDISCSECYTFPISIHINNMHHNSVVDLSFVAVCDICFSSLFFT